MSKLIHGKYSIYVFLLAALALMHIPFVSVPFKWLESFFHEISHGLAAVLTGGSVVNIELYPNGAGLCKTIGGSRFIVSFMGYAGAILFGVLLSIVSHMGVKAAKIVRVLLISVVVGSIIFWVRDLLTLLILVSIVALLVLSFKLQGSWLDHGLIKLIGLTVLLNSMLSPLYLLDNRAVGDGAALAELTLLPEIMWIASWFLMSLLGLYFVVKTCITGTDDVRQSL